MSDEHSVRLVIPTERFWPEYTGWVKQTLKLARSSGEQLEFFSVSRPPKKSTESEASQGNLPSNVQIRRRGPSLENDNLLWKIAYVLLAAGFIVRNRQAFDVLYLPYVFFPGFVFILLGVLIGLPVAIRISGQEVAPNRSLPARLRFWSLQFVDAVAVLNKTDRQRVRELGVDDERIWFIPNGVDVKQFSPPTSASVTVDESRCKGGGNTQEETLTTERETLCKEDSRMVIGFAGIICRRKGVRELLDAYDRIRALDDISQPVLLLAGPLEEVEEVDSSFVRETVRVAREYGDDVQLLGNVDNMVRFYRSLDLFVLPSYREGMPNVLLEAMSSGLPCVATDIPGVREVISSSENGMLVPRQDAQQLANTLTDLLRDDKQRQSLGRDARKTIVDTFSLDAMARQYKDLFASLVKEGDYRNPAYRI
ncbi:glycosyltransferase family 4 protein [Salinibacter ruber]|uniref:Glycosyltransferase involved in cell wall biosynthesis n=1 Tax=Salinibacter ruber TaxID=146919 RepID=A0A9X2U6Y6_9BACT|nr:glycosyltransferase family 4 protein [Salinibacter ruber]MCS3950921.1 glycosyltransferase involved in cell wall biosynthesis [Salinibacter ruber]